MTKDYTVDCSECGRESLVRERMARKEQCPNCHGYAKCLDELPEDTYE